MQIDYLIMILISGKLHNRDRCRNGPKHSCEQKYPIHASGFNDLFLQRNWISFIYKEYICICNIYSNGNKKLNKSSNSQNAVLTLHQVYIASSYVVVNVLRKIFSTYHLLARHCKRATCCICLATTTCYFNYFELLLPYRTRRKGCTNRITFENDEQRSFAVNTLQEYNKYRFRFKLNLLFLSQTHTCHLTERSLRNPTNMRSIQCFNMYLETYKQ